MPITRAPVEMLGYKTNVAKTKRHVDGSACAAQKVMARRRQSILDVPLAAVPPHADVFNRWAALTLHSR